MDRDAGWEDEVTEEDDDDMDFEPAIEDYNEEDDEDIFEDAEENILQALLNNGEVEIEVDEEEIEEEVVDDDEEEEPATAQPVLADVGRTRIASKFIMPSAL